VALFWFLHLPKPMPNVLTAVLVPMAYITLPATQQLPAVLTTLPRLPFKAV
jgi:hypothetical protein